MSLEYAITVTLKPVMYRHAAEIQFSQTYEVLLKHLRTFTPRITLLAELTKDFNVHYHGLIQFSKDDVLRYHNLAKRFKDSFRKSKVFGHIVIVMAHDLPGWKEYCTKDLEETYRLLGTGPVFIDYFNYVENTLNGYIQDVQ